MDKLSTLARPDSALRGMRQSILPITAVIWVANWGILVFRALALGADTAIAIRLVICSAGAASCLLISDLLPRRQMAPPRRFLAAFLCSLPALGIISLGHELLWLAGTNYYVERYGFGPKDVLISQCSDLSSPCGTLLLQTAFTVGTFIWVYVAWCAFYVGLTITAELREREHKLNVAERTAQEARLSALRFQLNPHFMFNTLNTLSGLIALDRKQQAEHVVLNLSSFLRFSLQSDSEQLISLEKEIEAQKMYLDIEQVRFSDRLTIHYEVDEECEQARVPPFLLQPLVENAIKHAVAPSDGPVTMTIGASREGNTLVLEVKNSASNGLARPRCESLGIGMKNVRNPRRRGRRDLWGGPGTPVRAGSRPGIRRPPAIAGILLRPVERDFARGCLRRVGRSIRCVGPATSASPVGESDRAINGWLGGLALRFGDWATDARPAGVSASNDRSR